MTRNLVAYLPFHARDAAVRALSPVALFAFVAGLPVRSLIAREGIEAVRAPGNLHDAVLSIYGQSVTLAMTLGAILVANGFIAQDRERGHVRFLFATPVVAWRFYLQRYLVGAALFVACYALVPVIFSWLVVPVPVQPVILSALLYAGLVGSLAMLAGALTRFDGSVIIGAMLVGSLLQGIVRASEGKLTGWMAWLAKALPPIDAADQVRMDWLAGRGADTGELSLVLAWTAAMLVTALFVVKRAPLVR